MSEENGKPVGPRANSLSGAQKFRLNTYVMTHRDRLPGMQPAELVKEVSDAMATGPDGFAVTVGNVAGAFKTLGLEYPRTRKDDSLRTRITGKFGDMADKVAALELAFEAAEKNTGERLEYVNRCASESLSMLARRVESLEKSTNGADAAKVAAGLLDKFAQLAGLVDKMAADLQTVQMAMLTLRREWDKVDYRNRDRGGLAGGTNRR